MWRTRTPISFLFLFAFSSWFLFTALPGRAEEPTPAAIAGFSAYTAEVEARLAQQHGLQASLLAAADPSPQAEARLRRGELAIESILPAKNPAFSGAMLHHWRGSAFVPGASTLEMERLLRDFPSYPRRFAPEVLQARVLARHGDVLDASMRVRQRHVLTVVLDTRYEIRFGRPDSQHGYSLARSTRITEIEASGTPAERALSPGEQHGFLWRQNTYWSYEERDGGLYLQIESVSLTRSIPAGLGWAVRPFVESVPRDSLQFTLHSTCNALRNDAAR